MEGLNIRTDLHLCYLITPYSEALCRDWQKCFMIINLLQVGHDCKPTVTNLHHQVLCLSRQSTMPGSHWCHVRKCDHACEISASNMSLMAD